MKYIWYLVLIVVICVFTYGLAVLGKNVSYSLFYKDMVHETICTEVKKEFLINPSKCE